MNNRVIFVDFAKGFSILTVVLYHYFLPHVNGVFAKALALGGTGVHMFFVLSGFGLYLWADKRQFTVFDFVRRRFVRILFPYYIIVLIAFLLNDFSTRPEARPVYALLSHVFIFKMFDENVIGSFGPHFWFISTIIQFYLAFPLLFRLSASCNPILFCAGSVVVSLLYAWFISISDYSSLRVVNSFFLQFLWEFVLGMLLGKAFLNGSLAKINLNSAVLVLSAFCGLGAMFFLVSFFGKAGRLFNDIPALIGYASIVLIFYRCMRFSGVSALLVFVGGISYEIYLVHLLVYDALTTYKPVVGYELHWVIYLAASVFSSLVFAYLLSRSVRRMYSSLLWLK